MGFQNFRKVGGDYFKLLKSNQIRLDCNENLDFHTCKFNIDDYYVFKSTGKFKEVSKTEFFDFKYAQYTLFKKALYDKNWLDLWIDWTNKNLYLLFLHKPFPPFNPKKIKIY
jgi:hypothetical protein